MTLEFAFVECMCENLERRLLCDMSTWITLIHGIILQSKCGFFVVIVFLFCVVFVYFFLFVCVWKRHKSYADKCYTFAVLRFESIDGHFRQPLLPKYLKDELNLNDGSTKGGGGTQNSYQNQLQQQQQKEFERNEDNDENHHHQSLVISIGGLTIIDHHDTHPVLSKRKL